jgi:tetratricopeptide (TPR) repeat protein
MKNIISIFGLFILLSAFSCNNKSASFYYSKAIKNDSLKKYYKAVNYFDKAIELDSSYADWYYKRGIAKQGLKQYLWVHPNTRIAKRRRNEYKFESVVNDFTKAIILNPKHAAAYNARAMARYDYCSIFRPSQEIFDDLNKSIEVDSTAWYAYIHRGMVWSNAGNKEKACEDYKKAAEINPKSDATRLIKQQCK